MVGARQAAPNPGRGNPAPTAGFACMIAGAVTPPLRPDSAVFALPGNGKKCKSLLKLPHKARIIQPPKPTGKVWR